MNKKLGILFRISGLPGSGKTQVAKLLHPKINKIFLIILGIVIFGKKRLIIPYMIKIIENNLINNPDARYVIIVVPIRAPGTV